MSPPYERHLAAGEEAAARYALVVPRRRTSGLGGVRLGHRSGSSLEFQEYREYRPGDDLRHLDWSAYARSDRFFVKLFREEVEPHLDLVVDGSRSMAPSGSVDPKAAATARLAALLAGSASRAGFSQAAWIAGRSCRPLGPRGVRPVEWQGFAFDSRGSLFEALERRPPAFRRRGLRVLLSDLLWEEEPRAILTRLSLGAAAVVVIRLLCEEDLEPPVSGWERLVDAETGEVRDILIDEAALRRYLAALEEQEESWRVACREIGVQRVTLTAEHLLAGWPAGELERLVELEVLELR